jgi:hypothetical protein
MAYTNSGHYSVRSAYNLARTEEFHKFRRTAKIEQFSNIKEEAGLWKKLWAITARAR